MRSPSLSVTCRRMSYEPVIGLEVHAQILTESKIFCGCSTRFGDAPNRNTCPVCMGFPGVLPVLNRKVVEHTIRTGLATHCAIARQSRWARKNYFYPDLPKGYQISQYELPLCTGGHVDVSVDGASKRVRLTRIHMEEDAGKNIHDVRGDHSLVDLNRAGVPLMEIVSEPDMRSPVEAGDYLRTLRSILEYLEVCDGNMEEGSFRCDANVSLRPEGDEELGVKVEIKNLNSFKAVEKALEYEIRRQGEVLSEGGAVSQETRLWDPDAEVTRAMRTKEFAHDYRYFPDPDLLPLEIDDEWIGEIHATLPELARERRQRFIDEYGLPAYDADILTQRRDVADYFEEAVKAHDNPKAVANWLMGDLFRVLKERKLDAALRIESWPVAAGDLARMVQLVDESTISGKLAKTVFNEMLETGKDPDAIVKEKGLEQVSDTGALETAVDEVLSACEAQVAEYRAGKEKVLGFLVGQVMKATRGKANPQMVNEILRSKL
ncbi:MAG: Asp-tRNA(Asn)/Glu-tRNA(Gln) amidotransferase subunit GatB [Deltaproteobacteria bacterium]|nr:Asp-tRNA(Asn)/Glu-tRNA(Gln) amidotransferase subunit GatB [Deltaproteobacteria bacterium]